MIYLFLLNALFANFFQPLNIESEVSQTHSTFNHSQTFGKEEQEILNLINKQRDKYGLAELEWDNDLARLAKNYSEKMARERFFSHYEDNGDSIADRAKKSRITRWRKIGENLFTCEGYSKFTKLAVEGWLKSTGHRRNMLNEDFNQTGIGIAKTRGGKIYITQVFIER